ncbi:MAG: hypothetical protein ACTSRW_02085 [Candidatus Helarchaeota archaeon]
MDFSESNIESDHYRKTKRDKVAYILTLLSVSPFQIVLIILFSYSTTHRPSLYVFGELTYPVMIAHEFLLVLVSMAFILFFPLIPVIFLRKKGKVQKYTTHREDRWFLLGLSLVGWFIVIPIYIYLDLVLLINLRVFIMFGTIYFVIGVINLIITTLFKFKTSLHMSGATCSITTMWICYGFFGGVPEYQLFFLLYFLLPPIAWAKWQMQESFEQGHSTWQLISGFLIGLIIPFIMIWAFKITIFPIIW